MFVQVCQDRTVGWELPGQDANAGLPGHDCPAALGTKTGSKWIRAFSFALGALVFFALFFHRAPVLFFVCALESAKARKKRGLPALPTHGPYLPVEPRHRQKPVLGREARPWPFDTITRFVLTSGQNSKLDDWSKIDFKNIRNKYHSKIIRTIHRIICHRSGLALVTGWRNVTVWHFSHSSG
jgi:hypothetical protein